MLIEQGENEGNDIQEQSGWVAGAGPEPPEVAENEVNEHESVTAVGIGPCGGQAVHLVPGSSLPLPWKCHPFSSPDTNSPGWLWDVWPGCSWAPLQTL